MDNQNNYLVSLNEEDTLYGVSQEVIEQIERALELGDVAYIQTMIVNVHAADIADILYRLESTKRLQFIDVLKPLFNPHILIEVEESIRDEIIEALDRNTLARVISTLDSDDAVKIIESLDDHHKESILRALPANERAIYLRYLSYPEKSAGRLMQREIVSVSPEWSVQQTTEYIKNASGLPETFYDIFVIDEQLRCLGKLALNALLKHHDTIKIGDIMNSDVHTIPVVTDREEVARIFNHYTLVSAPVISSTGRIVGMITIDDVIQVIEEEAEEDILYMAKVSSGSDFFAPAGITAYWRIRWLLITIINTLLATFVISRFEGSIKEITALSFLMTINAAMGGNAGMQVVTVVVRALATRHLRESDFWKAVRKELSVGFYVSGFCATVLSIFAAIWQQNIALGCVLFMALVANMMWAAFAGTILPIIVNRLGFDPAISAGPFLTTTTDVFGYFTFLGLATLLLL